MRTGFRNFVDDNRGAAAAELVLILPLAILMMVVAMEAGNYLYQEHQVVKGVRDAARFASRLPFTAYNCTAASANANLAAGTNWTSIANVAVYGMPSPPTGQEKRVWTWNADTTDISIQYACVANTTGIYSDAGFAPQITVIGKPTYPSLFHAMSGFSSTWRLFGRQQAVGVGI